MSVIKNKYTHLSLIIFLFVVLVSIGIGDDSLWLDESESWMWATAIPISSLVEATGQSNHAPTYYATLHGWIKIGNDSDTWIRLLSLVFMALAIPLVYLLGVVIASHRVGMIVALLFITSPFIYEFAQEARPYSLLTLSATAVLLICAVAIRKYIIEKNAPTLIGLGWRKGQYKADLLWLGFLASMLVSITTHHTALVLLPIIGGIWFSLIIFSKHRWIHLINMCICSGVIAAIYSAFFLHGFLESFSNFKQGGVAFEHAIYMLLIIYGNGRIIWANLLFIIPLLFTIWKLYSTKQWAWLLFLLVASTAMFIIVIFIGQVHGSVFKWRTMIWVSIPCFVIIGYGLANIKPFIGNILLSAIIVTNITAVVLVNQSVKQPWEQIASEVNQRFHPGDAILACPAYNHKSFYRYWDGPTSDLWGYNSRSDEKTYRMPKVNANLEEYRKYPEGNVFTLDEFKDKYDSIWVVMSWHPECREMGEHVVDISFDRHIWILKKIVAYEGNLMVRKLE